MGPPLSESKKRVSKSETVSFAGTRKVLLTSLWFSRNLRTPYLHSPDPFLVTTPDDFLSDTHVSKWMINHQSISRHIDDTPMEH